MKDYGISVLTQYQMEVFGTHKVRGAILCDTDKGLLLLKETRMEESRICALAKIYEQLNAKIRLCLIKRMLMSVKPRMEQAIS